MIIGFMGLAGTGKSTAGKILVDEYGFIPLSFAGTLKDAVSVLFGWPRHLLEGDTIESRTFRDIPDAYWSNVFGKPFTPRYALQFIGTDVIRDHLLGDFWIRAVEKKMQDESKSYVITDARFANEFDFIRSLGGFVVEIVNQYKMPKWIADIHTTWEPEIAKSIAIAHNIHPSEYEHVLWRISNPADYMIYNTFDEAQNTTTMENLAASITHMIRVFTGPKDTKTAKNKVLDTAF